MLVGWRMDKYILRYSRSRLVGWLVGWLVGYFSCKNKRKEGRKEGKKEKFLKNLNFNI
jgi:hypothetical protein